MSFATQTKIIEDGLHRGPCLAHVCNHDIIACEACIISNTVAAGLIASEMAAAGMAAASVQAAAQAIILKRMGTPQEVADAVVFLSSDTISYITAQSLNVNGGLYL